MSNPLSSFNHGVRPPSRPDRGGGGGAPPGSSKVSPHTASFDVGHDSEHGLPLPCFPFFDRQSYVLPIPSGFSVRVFKASTLDASRQCSNAGQQPSTVSARGDIDYKPSAHRDPRSSSGPPVRDAPRKLVKPPPSSHAHVQEDRERERDRDRGYRDTRRFGYIHPGPVADTYIYERSIASSKSDPYHDYYYPPSSDSTASEIDSLFSHTSSGSSNSSVDDDCPPRGKLQVARTTPERRPSYGHGHGHGHGGQRSGTSFPMTYHTCPTCSEMSSSPPSRTAGRPEGASHGSRPLPTPPVSARVRKDSLVLASERSVPPQATRPRLPQLRIGDRPAYPADAPQGTWSTAETGGYTSASPPGLTRSSSLRSSGSTGSSSHGGVPPPPGLNVLWEYGQTIDITAEPPHRQPSRRNSDGDQGQIMPPRPRRCNTVPPPRSVRWLEELVCPSPILPSERRKGWFNRRGDQLWRNDGSYRPPGPGQDYPEDLDDYPESSEGWQNEDGVRIDLNRRLIPKAPPRSVLKWTNYCKEDSIIAGYLTNGPSSPTSEDE
ncbi:hypothetical protein OG21DRAFT_1483831 [Imleria badia]|nr:hypothetical protein OG21DRAFT_1483831 [Imleria badia]